jgi:hypothetical protein
MSATIQPEPLSSRLLCRNIKIRIFKTIILPVVPDGYVTWPVTIKEKHRLRVIVNRVLSRLFGLKRDEVMGWWRKWHNEKLHNLYCSPCIIRMFYLVEDEVGKEYSMNGMKRNAYTTFVYGSARRKETTRNEKR